MENYQEIFIEVLFVLFMAGLFYAYQRNKIIKKDQQLILSKCHELKIELDDLLKENPDLAKKNELKDFNKKLEVLIEGKDLSKLKELFHQYQFEDINPLLSKDINVIKTDLSFYKS